MKKIIYVKDLNKFYKRLWFYKSFLFKFTKFKLVGENTKELETTLNIKNRKKRLTYLYDKTCQDIDSFYKDKNMCCFKNNICLTGVPNGCCRKCRYQTSGKCPTNNIACKLFYCTKAREHNSYLEFNDLPLLKCLTRGEKYLLSVDYFSTREQVINDLYFGLIIGGLRLIGRMLLNFSVKYNVN
jgi:hypothetical protein